MCRPCSRRLRIRRVCCTTCHVRRHPAPISRTRLAADVGIARNTVRSWLTVLESSYLLMRVPAWHATVRKQVARTPKLHTLDSGPACYLLGIRTVEQLRVHPLRGALFESWVASELRKQAVHTGRRAALFTIVTRAGKRSISCRSTTTRSAFWR